jgi:hypothetical protein
MWLDRRGAGVASELAYLLFYAGFFFFVVFIANTGMSGVGLSASFVEPPSLGTVAPGILDYLSFTFNYVVYFFSLQGLTIAGLGSLYAALISVPLNIGFVYVVLRLIRGGG